MEQYIDSYNYGELVSELDTRIQVDNDAARSFFIDIREQLENVLLQLQNAYAERSDQLEELGYEDCPHPESLRDFDDAPTAVVEDNYEVWDRYCDSLDLYTEDTGVMLKMISGINRIIDLIGGLD